MSTSFPSLIIGDVTVEPTQRLPGNAFTSTPQVARSTNRAEDGTLHITDKYIKYSIGVSGLALDTIQDLRFEYEKPETIELHSIVPRRERLDSAGTTSTFSLSRKTRLDQIVEVQSPLGTTIPASSISTSNVTLFSVTLGSVDVGFIPVAGTSTIYIDYYPIFIGSISDMDSEYNWVEDEETWSLTFEEV